MIFIIILENDKPSDRKPDPVHEVCDISVKIADLGNACWVVCIVLCFNLNVLFVFES